MGQAPHPTTNSSPRSPRPGVAVALVSVLGLAACGSTSLTETIGVAVGSTVQPEPPVEIYSRVARGALSCWFGVNGSLKKTHVFHADAAPPSAGGEAEIVLHERDTAAQSPRSLRAFRVVFAKSNEGTQVKIENLRFPEAMANDMKADVVRWSGGKSD